MEASGGPDAVERVKAVDAPKGSGARLAQLYQQCSSAARRGDCTSVRRLVLQIKQEDRGYRGRLARDAAVAKCLASEASQASEASE
jgi:hypothetical protein